MMTKYLKSRKIQIHNDVIFALFRTEKLPKTVYIKTGAVSSSIIWSHLNLAEIFNPIWTGGGDKMAPS